MKITFYSNFLNHHQLPFCTEMARMLGDEFTFVATKPIEKERLLLGYADMNKQFPFVLRSYESKTAYDRAKLLAEESDVIIVGSAPNIFVDIRMKHNKLTFKYTERFFKKGTYRRFIPSTRKKIYDGYAKYSRSNLHVLCASAYTSYDLSVCGMKDKTYKWGYFPEVKNHDLDALIKNKNKNKVPKLLWVGRFLDWKHADDSIKVAHILKNEGYEFTLDIIGTGDMESNLKGLIINYQLSDRVKLLGSMKPEEVREHMESANIFLFTSDFNEGWGAVLNEAMNSGCAVVASHAIGSVPFLISNKKNGLIYKYGDLKKMHQSVKMLLDNSELCKQLGKEAYKTLEQTWNAKEAAKRFISLSESILKDEKIKFEEGPCSKAEIIKNNWYRE